MQYTKNLGLKLRRCGFEFQSSMKNSEVDFEDFKQNDIEVTVDHAMKDVVITIIPDSPLGEQIPIKGVRTMNELKQLHRLIYGAQKSRTNNEEGD